MDVLTQIRLKHGSLTVSAAQNEIKIKFCNAMNQLNDIDSRGVGLSILHSMIDQIPDKLLHLVIEPFYAMNPELKALCRKEVALLIGYIASKRGNTPLFYKYLGKLASNLSKRAQDSDSRVREACGDAFARMTKQCIRYIDSLPPHSELPHLSSTNELIAKLMKPIMRNIEKCISPNSITGNFLCLSNVILSADNYLNLTHVIIICKCIVSNIINIRDAKTHVSLLFCIEKLFIVAAPILSSTTKSNKNQRPRKHGHDADEDYLSALLAIIMDGLSNNDWNVRHHALKAIHSVGIIFANIKEKPEIECNRDEILAHLQRLKYDKVSNVRNTAIMALAVWSDLQNENESAEMDGVAGDHEQDEDVIDDELDDLRIKQITEKAWFDSQSPREQIESHNEIKTMEMNATNKTEECNQEEKECTDEHASNALIVRQQQLMLKSMKNLELYMRREVGQIKSRIHSVERDLQRFKVLQQNQEWTNENKRANAMTDRDKMNNTKTKVVAVNDGDGDELLQHMNANMMDMEMKNEDENHASSTVQQTETMSIYSDETQMINLNEQLLNIIQLDNNTELIQWLTENHHLFLFECIDQRLMISLIYRITQLLKTNQYVHHICDFLNKEFVIGVQNIPRDFSIPKPLKTEFLNGLNQHDNIKQFLVDIANAIR